MTDRITHPTYSYFATGNSAPLNVQEYEDGLGRLVHLGYEVAHATTGEPLGVVTDIHRESVTVSTGDEIPIGELAVRLP